MDFCFFARNMGNISKNSSSIYSQKLLNHAKQSVTHAIKTASKRVIQKTVEATGDLIGNNIADKITRVSKTSTQSNLETNEEEILRERYISPQQRKEIIDDLRLINICEDITNSKLYDKLPI